MENSRLPAAKLVIVSGRSGSGKSTALHVLEDAGFYCIDNLPAMLLPQLLAQGADEFGLARIAVSIDARNMPSSITHFGAANTL
jgi:RNase adapter protein RapZ